MFIDRYENKLRLVFAHLSSVFSVKPMKGESSQEIKRIISSISSPLGALESLKRPVSKWDDVLVYQIVLLLDSETHHVLLSTAMVSVCSGLDDNDVIIARALIDQGLQTSFVSESLCQRVNVKYKSVDVPISGVGGQKNFRL
ncbi:hypothetical protein WA026_022996 [Henosepilachna vigintioctopunctata]|uniref:Uncharacterized protein n=2 Tax=Henosepilachna vigintioctopunctata TaxID=420089 RepID=A0AAW1UNX3_9CUCU